MDGGIASLNLAARGKHPPGVYFSLAPTIRAGHHNHHHHGKLPWCKFINIFLIGTRL